MVLAGSLEERPQMWLNLEVIRMLEKNNNVLKIEHQMLKTKEGFPLKPERNFTKLDEREPSQDRVDPGAKLLLIEAFIKVFEGWGQVKYLKNINICICECMS